MNTIFRELKSVSGSVLMLTMLLIVVFFIWNWLSSVPIAPVSGLASWVQTHANGSAYGGVATPVSGGSNAAVSYAGPLN